MRQGLRSTSGPLLSSPAARPESVAEPGIGAHRPGLAAAAQLIPALIASLLKKMAIAASKICGFMGNCVALEAGPARGMNIRVLKMLYDAL